MSQFSKTEGHEHSKIGILWLEQVDSKDIWHDGKNPDAIWYEGDIKNGLPNGYGIVHFNVPGWFYEGEVVNGCQHGKGKSVYGESNNYLKGITYEGEWKKDLYHGEGKITWDDGVTYKGTFQDGNIIGRGDFYVGGKFCLSRPTERKSSRGDFITKEARLARKYIQATIRLDQLRQELKEQRRALKEEDRYARYSPYFGFTYPRLKPNPKEGDRYFHGFMNMCIRQEIARSFAVEFTILTDHLSRDEAALQLCSPGRPVTFSGPIFIKNGKSHVLGRADYGFTESELYVTGDLEHPFYRLKAFIDFSKELNDTFTIPIDDLYQECRTYAQNAAAWLLDCYKKRGRDKKNVKGYLTNKALAWEAGYKLQAYIDHIYKTLPDLELRHPQFFGQG